MPKAKRNMLRPEDGKHYFELFLPLLAFADQDTPILLGNLMDMKRRANIVWRDPSLIDGFIQDMDSKELERPLTEEDRQILRSWKRFRTGAFYVVSHEASGTFLVSKSKEVYRIKGLQSPMEELFPNPPVLVETTLHPWKDLLIADGIYTLDTIQNPEKVRDTLQALCRQAVMNDTVISSI